MIGVYSVRHIRLAESELMARLPDGALMQRAASALAAQCARVLGGPYGANVALLVGAGDNGGDALYAGARLARRGARVDAVLVRPDRVHARGLAAFQEAGGRVSDRPVRSIARADLVLDGMLGIGGRGGLRDDAARLAEIAEDRGGLVVAVDLPSGIEPDSGETSGPHVRADLTVTFGARKIGLVVDPAAAAAGRIVDVDIGLAPYLPRPTVEVLDDGEVARLLPVPARDDDKYRRGVVGVLAGSPEYTGAAVLSVGGAVRGGAGMVRYPGAAADAVRARWPEVVAASGQVQAWVIGPGLGESQRSDAAKALADGVPVLVDADGLRHLPARFDNAALLTPHAGELARLLGESREDVEARRLHFATAAARRWNATVLLKGSTTLVAAPDGRVRVNPTGTPALSTAGSGDVLSGLAGSLLASGLTPLDAGSVAAYVHGLAGRLAARTAAYPTAADVLDALPHAFPSR
ncbi:MAG TPA: NAD(P)H-hydrate dehydratase [Jiangellaceae bacterium]|nr:NAD(P)H-hydrate dehydratase [Jiangellaceae bacterium]